MKITIDDKFMDWILDLVKGYYCIDVFNCSCPDECPYYYKNRKHIQDFVSCTEIPLLEKLMIARKLYEKEGK